MVHSQAVQSVLEPDRDPLVSADSIQLYIPYQVQDISSRSSQSISNPIVPIPATIVDSRLSDEIISIYRSTGEHYSTRQYQPLTQEQEGIPQGYKIVHRVIGKQSVLYISIAISSKLLSHDYFQGITLQNIHLIHQALIRHKVIFITLPDLLKCPVHHADLKYDFISLDPIKTFQTIQHNLRPNLPDLHIYRSRINDRVQTHGIQIGSRMSKRLIKFYYKSQELKTQSSVFYEKQLHFQCPDNLIRTEITFSSKQLRYSFPTYDGTLQSLLINTHQIGKQAMTQILHQDIFNPSVITSQEPEEPKSSDDAALNQKLSEQISNIIDICLRITPQPTLHETQDIVLGILQPGVNRRAKVRRFTEFLFTKALEKQIINQEIKETLHL